jgi:RNA polymerase sigma-70 factor (ECF subfamily)
METTLALARRGDEAAQRELYEQFRGRVLRLANALLGDPDDAEDVMQDVMVYALTHLTQYDESRAAFGTWLHMITVSRCRDRARRRRLSVRRLADLWRSDRRAEDPADRLGGIDAAGMLERGLAALTPTQREALALRHIEGLSFEEMGTVLGVPMRTAQARVASGTAALRRVLGEAPPASAGPRSLEVESG